MSLVDEFISKVDKRPQKQALKIVVTLDEIFNIVKEKRAFARQSKRKC